MQRISVLGIDLAKQVFQLCGRDEAGRVVLEKKLRRSQLMPFLRNLPACLVAMESCATSNYWGRQAYELGHQVRLIAPQFVKPFVKSNKNDAADAEAISEAAVRPTMRYVPIKTLEQQEVQCLHRVRSRLVRSRTALINELHGLLAEFGIMLPLHESKRLQLASELCDPENETLSPRLKRCIGALVEELHEINRRVKTVTDEVEQFAKNDHASQLLQSIPGIGKLTATALSMHIGSQAKEYRNGRQFAASLGLVPRQHSSGGKSLLLGISKRGDPYLRTLLVHGARSVLRVSDAKMDPRSKWINQLKRTRGINRTAVALANKNARIAWAVLATGKSYRCRELEAAA